jgi:hypothetical protein
MIPVGYQAHGTTRLRYVVAVAEELNVRQAAARLDLSRSETFVFVCCSAARIPAERRWNLLQRAVAPSASKPRRAFDICVHRDGPRREGAGLSRHCRDNDPQVP